MRCHWLPEGGGHDQQIFCDFFVNFGRLVGGGERSLSPKFRGSAEGFPLVRANFRPIRRFFTSDPPAFPRFSRLSRGLCFPGSSCRARAYGKKKKIEMLFEGFDRRFLSIAHVLRVDM